MNNEESIVSNIEKLLIDIQLHEDNFLNLMTRNLMFNIDNFDYLYEVKESDELYQIGVLSIHLYLKLNINKYVIEHYDIKADLIFLRQKTDDLIIMIESNRYNIHNDVFKINDSTFFNIEMKNNMLLTASFESINKLKNYIFYYVKIRDNIDIYINIYSYLDRLDNCAYFWRLLPDVLDENTNVMFYIDIDSALSFDLPNTIYILKKIYDEIRDFNKPINKYGLTLKFLTENRFNFEAPSFLLYMKKLSKFFNNVFIVYNVYNENKIYMY